MANFYNPNNIYGYPYNPGMPNERQNNNYQNLPPVLKQYAFVNGIEGAKAYPLMPNQMMLLMDADNPILYRKTSDSMGKSTIDYFTITQVSENQVRDILTPKQPEYALKSDINAINSKIDELLKALNPKKEEAVNVTENKGE